MANPLTSSIARLFRDRAEPTSLRRLKREGYRKVPVLDIAQLEELVGAAIEKVIMETSEDPEQGRKIAKNAQLEFLKMLGNPASLARAGQELVQEQKTLEMNLRMLRNSLEEARSDLAERVASNDQELMQSMEAEVTEVLDDILAHTSGVHADNKAVPPVLTGLKDPLRDAFISLMHDALSQTRSVDDEESGAKVTMLERRVRKLNASLDEARSMLTRLRDKRSAEEEGVASVYSDVQGLTGREEHYEQRKKLLKEVFQLNLDIRKEIRNEETGSASGTPAS